MKIRNGSNSIPSQQRVRIALFHDTLDLRLLMLYPAVGCAIFLMSESIKTSAPLRVLHLVPASVAEGVKRYVFDLCFAMTSRGHVVTVAGEVGSWKWLFDAAPFPWVQVRFGRGFFGSRKAPRALLDWAGRNDFDLLHVHDRTCISGARELQKQREIPLLLTLHQTDLRGNKPAGSDFGDHTHVASKEARDWLVNVARVPQRLISVLPHGVDARRFPFAGGDTKAVAKQALGLGASDLVAAYVGRMDSGKNESWMLDLAASSREKLPNLKVVMVGEGPREAMLRRRVLRQKLGDRVVLLGRRDPLPIYHAADALLLPSQREGFSLVCAEAMSTGIPVLRTRTAGTDALVVENATGRSVPIDHDAFIATAIDFLADRDGLKRMGRLAALHVQEHFTVERQLRDTIDMYRSLIRLQGEHAEKSEL
jgi:glycosyltransferase involved in cell wall biosynthesis